MKNEQWLNQQYDFDVNWIKEQILYSNIMPGQKWYTSCENRNDEISRDEEFEGIYGWLEVDKEKEAKKYRGMVNEFRKRCGLEEI